MRFVKIAHISQECVLKIEFFEDFVLLQQSCLSRCWKKFFLSEHFLGKYDGIFINRDELQLQEELVRQIMWIIGN